MEMMRRKAVFFSMDAAIALTFLTLLYLLVLTHNPASVAYSSDYQQLHLVTEDAMTVFASSRFSDINESVRESLISSTNITHDDLDSSLPDVAGKLWAYGESDSAADLVESFFNGLIPDDYSYAVTIEGSSGARTILYEKTGPGRDSAKAVAASLRMVSGYEENLPSESFVASAWATGARKNTTRVEAFPLAGGAWDGENFTVTHEFGLPEQMNLTSAELFLSVVYIDEKLWIDVNGQGFDNDDVRWLYTSETGEGTLGAYGVLNTTGLKNAILNGNNTVSITLAGTGSAGAYTNPGTMLRVQYSTEELSETISKKIYFDRVEGRPAAYEVLPLHVPKGAVVYSAALHVEAGSVDRKAFVYVNGNELVKETNPSSSPAYDLDILTSINAELTGSEYVSTGETNIIAVYFDIASPGSQTQPPAGGARDECEIKDNSYVEVDYRLPLGLLEYGMVEVTAVEEFGGIPEEEKNGSFSLPDRELVRVFIHPVQYASCRMAAAAWHDGEAEPVWSGNKWDQHEIFNSPMVRTTPPSIYVPLDRLAANSTNYIKMKDSFGGCSGNFPILPESVFEYTLLLPGQVGYGDNFPTLEEALADANQRLAELLGEYAEATSIENDAIYMTNVPWMWGPALLRMEVWR